MRWNHTIFYPTRRSPVDRDCRSDRSRRRFADSHLRSRSIAPSANLHDLRDYTWNRNLLMATRCVGRIKRNRSRIRFLGCFCTRNDRILAERRAVQVDSSAEVSSYTCSADERYSAESPSCRTVRAAAVGSNHSRLCLNLPSCSLP